MIAKHKVISESTAIDQFSENVKARQLPRHLRFALTHVLSLLQRSDCADSCCEDLDALSSFLDAPDLSAGLEDELEDDIEDALLKAKLDDLFSLADTNGDNCIGGAEIEAICGESNFLLLMTEVLHA